ncbi:TnsD family transposase [Neiella marina]|uniref:TnsD family transposase n=1 Tax=Neiella holothuriorum TaxID=2870530 RepID=A0ABS7EHJ7_9GAMM|nr:TnsD family Tn7-like transposition protein [Neiella holothuriorum]MBW8191818.1 TnsD family transposase [Neiella holothuriorum]
MITLPIYSRETVYSWLVRQVLLSGLPYPRAALKSLIGDQHFQLTSLLPGYSKSLAENSLCDVDELLNEHTTMNYFRLFSSPSKYESLRVELEAGCSITMVNQHGWLATLSQQPRELRYCPVCATDEYLRLGVAYWHVEHQLPGCIACAKHGVYLIGIKRWRNMLELPLQHPDQHLVIAPSAATKLAQLSVELLCCTDAFLAQRQLAQAYRIRLAELGLATTTQKLYIDQYGFREKIEETWRALRYEPSVAAVLSLGHGQMFPKCMSFYHQSQHPLRHLLVIGALFSSVTEMLEYYHSLNARHQTLLSQRHVRQPRTPYEDESLVRRVLSQLSDGLSMNAISRQQRCSAKIIKRIALQHGVTISRNPKFLHHAARRKIWRLLLIGQPCSEIAKIMDCSKAAIELELSYYPELKPLRKKIQYFKLQQKHRTALLKATDAFPNYSRTQLQKRYKATYSWLYKNDTDWLNSHLPPTIPISERQLGKAKNAG